MNIKLNRLRRAILEVHDNIQIALEDLRNPRDPSSGEAALVMARQGIQRVRDMLLD